MQQTIIFAISIIFMLLGILYQTMIGVCYQRMIQATDGISGTNNKLLKQCKERFVQCYQTNGGVSNIGAFVEKYVGRLKFMGMTMHFLKNLSIQFQNHRPAALLHHQSFRHLFVSKRRFHCRHSRKKAGSAYQFDRLSGKSCCKTP